MKQENKCSFLCNNKNEMDIDKKSSQLLRQRIFEDYYVNLYVPFILFF